MSGTGRYSQNLFREERRYEAALHQRSERGLPAYMFDSDLRDWAQRQVIERQRWLQTVHPTPAFRDDSWKVVPETAEGYAEDNFRLLGRQAEGAVDSTLASKWGWGYVGGLRALLHKSADFNCEADLGEFDLSRADALHRRWTSVGAGYVEDQKARWTAGYFDGRGRTCRLWNGDYVITSNTQTRLYLQDFVPADVPSADGDTFYFVKLPSPEAEAVTIRVFLDVHLEDWGMAQDPILNKNPLGSPLEGARRLKTVQQVRVEVDDGTDTFAAPIADYRDYGGTEHWVAELASWNWEGDGDPAAVDEDDIVDARDPEAGSGPEIRDARAVGGCVPADQQPDNLYERLERGRNWVTVGPAGKPGLYVDEVGLRAALACASVKSLWLNAGTITLTAALSIPAGKELHLEPGAIIDAATYGITLGAGSRISGGTLQGGKLDGPVLSLSGAGSQLERVTVTDTDPETESASALVSVTGAGARLLRCSIIAGTRRAVSIAQTLIARPSSGLGADLGCTLLGCFVHSLYDLGVYVSGGFEVHLQASTIVGAIGAVDIRGEGREAVRGAFPLAFDGVAVDDCVLIANAYDEGGPAAQFALRARNATLRMGHNQLEVGVVEEGAAPPTATLWIESVEGLTGETVVDGNVIRAGVYGILFAGTSASRAVIANNIVIPHSLDTLYGIHATTTSVSTQGVEVHHNLVIAAAAIDSELTVTTYGIVVGGFARVHQNHVDFAGVGIVANATVQSRNSIEGNLVTSCLTGIRVKAGDYATLVRANQVYDCGTGVRVLGSTCVIRDLICIGFTGRAVDVSSYGTGGQQGTTLQGGLLSAADGADYTLRGVDTVRGVDFYGTVAGAVLYLRYDMEVTDCLFRGAATAIALSEHNGSVRLNLRNCVVTGAFSVPPVIEQIVARQCDFHLSAAVALNGYNNFGEGLLDVGDCLFLMNGVAAITGTNARALIHRCTFQSSTGDAYSHAAVSLTGPKEISLDDCHFDNGSRAMVYLKGDDISVRRCRVVSQRLQISNPLVAFDPLDRGIYVESATKAATSRAVIEDCDVIGCGIAAYAGGLRSRIHINRCSVRQGPGIWGRGSVIIDGNTIEVAKSLADDYQSGAIESTPIYIGHPNAWPLDEGDVARTAEIAAAVSLRPVVRNNTIPWGGRRGSDWTVNASVGRAGAIVITSAVGPVVEDNRIGQEDESDSAEPQPWTAILLGYAAQIEEASGYRAEVVDAIVRNNAMGSGKLVLVVANNTGAHVVANNVWHLPLGADPLEAIYVYHSAGATAAGANIPGTVRVRGNTVSSRWAVGYDTDRGHDPNHWGLIRVSKIVRLDKDDAGGDGNVAIEPMRIRSFADEADHQDITGLLPDASTPVARVDLLRLLNDLAIGDDLD